MPDAIEITKSFPASRERTVLLELLKIARTLKEENIEAVICGGWVPFLKELAKHSEIAHKGSLDIDVLLRARARERESIDRIKNLLSEPPAFHPSKADAFRYEKNIEGNVVQLDLLADLPRRREDESVLKIHGATSSLQVCLADGAENLGNHVETIQINCREGESLETFEITVPDAVGFLILKTTVTRFREKARDPYDVYFYCRYSQDAATTRQMLASAIQEPAVARAVESLKKMFTHEDSKWVEMVLDEMLATGDARDREARFVVRAVGRAIEGL